MNTKMDVTIRRAAGEDFFLIMQIADTFEWDFCPTDLHTVLALNPDLWYVAETRDGEIAGAIGATRPCPEVACATYFLVRPEFRGQRLGESLLQALAAGSGLQVNCVSAFCPVSLRSKLHLLQMGFHALSHKVFCYRGNWEPWRLAFDRRHACAVTWLNDVNKNSRKDVEARLLEYDAAVRGSCRDVTFFKEYVIGTPDSVVAIGVDHETESKVVGYGVLRSHGCGGYHVGPLYADSLEAADSILCQLLDRVEEGYFLGIDAVLDFNTLWLARMRMGLDFATAVCVFAKDCPFTSRTDFGKMFGVTSHLCFDYV